MDLTANIDRANIAMTVSIAMISPHSSATNPKTRSVSDAALGAARIRVRSLIAALRVRDKKNYERKINSSAYHRKVFTKDMKKDYTILCPQMSPIHFDLLEPALNAFGYYNNVPRKKRSVSPAQ